MAIETFKGGPHDGDRRLVDHELSEWVFWAADTNDGQSFVHAYQLQPDEEGPTYVFRGTGPLSVQR